MNRPAAHPSIDVYPLRDTRHVYTSYPRCHFGMQTGKMITIPITAGIVGEVVRTKTLRNVADTSKDM